MVPKMPATGSYGAVQKQLAAILQRVAGIEGALSKDVGSTAV